MTTESKKAEYKTVIEANNPWKPFNFKEIFAYKDFFYFKIINGFKSQQKQTILGYFWVIFDPAFSILFYTIIFGKVANIDTGEMPYVVFNTAAVLGWSYLNKCMNASTASLKSESNLIQKVYFPRSIIPLIPCIVEFPNFLLRLVLTLCLLAWFGFYPGFELLYLIPMLLIMVVFSMGMGLLITPFRLQYRDLDRIWGYFMRFYAYAIPMVYSIDNLPVSEFWKNVYMLNPAAPLIAGFRGALTGTEIPWIYVGISALTSLLIFYIGGVIFKHKEPNIVDAL